MNQYVEFLKKQERTFNALPLAYAYSEEQLKDAMKKLGVSSPDELLRGPSGCLFRKQDRELIHNTIRKLDTELKECLHESYSFAYDAFKYELGNHEYCITYDAGDALTALSLNYDWDTGRCKELETNPDLQRAFDDAVRDCTPTCEEE